MNQGIVYENLVLETLKTATMLMSNVQVHCEGTASFDATKPDLELKICGNTLNIEIKGDPNCQMGGTSIQYIMSEDGNTFQFTSKSQEKVDKDTQNMVISAIQEKEADIINLMQFWKQQEPLHYHEKIRGIPSVVAREAYSLSVKNGLLKPINTKIAYDERFIHDHYHSKNCYYIQVGKAGLFYLKDNPLDLPIPQLKGDINLEVRVSRAGSTLNKELGIKTAGTGLRLQGRLQFKNKSTYSLDSVDDVKTLLGKF